MNETTVTVVGNVASDLKARRVGADDARVVGFRVASSERRWDRVNESWTDGPVLRMGHLLASSRGRRAGDPGEG